MHKVVNSNVKKNFVREKKGEKELFDTLDFQKVRTGESGSQVSKETDTNLAIVTIFADESGRQVLYASQKRPSE